jgi:hypothetical protein
MDKKQLLGINNKIAQPRILPSHALPSSLHPRPIYVLRPPPPRPMSTPFITLSLHPDCPWNCTLDDADTNTTLYDVRTVIKSQTCYTFIRDSSDRVIATLRWRDLLSDMIMREDGVWVPLNSWLKKSLMPFNLLLFLFLTPEILAFAYGVLDVAMLDLRMVVGGDIPGMVMLPVLLSEYAIMLSLFSLIP